MTVILSASIYSYLMGLKADSTLIFAISYILSLAILTFSGSTLINPGWLGRDAIDSSFFPWKRVVLNFLITKECCFLVSNVFLVGILLVWGRVSYPSSGIELVNVRVFFSTDLLALKMLYIRMTLIIWGKYLSKCWGRKTVFHLTIYHGCFWAAVVQVKSVHLVETFLRLEPLWHLNQIIKKRYGAACCRLIIEKLLSISILWRLGSELTPNDHLRSKSSRSSQLMQRTLVLTRSHR